MMSDHHGGTKLQFWPDTDVPDISEVDISVPTSTWGAKASDCGSRQPKGVTCSIPKDSDQKVLDDFAPSPDDWVDIPATTGHGWGADVNSEYASFAIPTVDVLQEHADGTEQGNIDAIAYVSFHVAMEDDYNWADGTQPQNLTSGDPAFPIRTQASWSPTTENGTAQSVIDHAQFNTFMAGAAVGVAAAAFASAIAELVGTSATQTRTRRRIAAESATTPSP